VARIACRELVCWMAADYGFDEIDACMLLSQAGRIRPGNMVDAKYIMGASILGRVDFEKISGLMIFRQPRGGLLQ
jgi:hypothetical protein